MSKFLFWNFFPPNSPRWTSEDGGRAAFGKNQTSFFRSRLEKKSRTHRKDHSCHFAIDFLLVKKCPWTQLLLRLVCRKTLPHDMCICAGHCLWPCHRSQTLSQQDTLGWRIALSGNTGVQRHCVLPNSDMTPSISLKPNPKKYGPRETPDERIKN